MSTAETHGVPRTDRSLPAYACSTCISLRERSRKGNREEEWERTGAPIATGNGPAGGSRSRLIVVVDQYGPMDGWIRYIGTEYVSVLRMYTRLSTR